MEGKKSLRDWLRTPEGWIPGVAALVVLAAFLRWRVSEASPIWQPRLAAGLSAALFALVILALGPRTIAALRGKADPPVAPSADDRPRWARTRAACLFALALVVYLVASAALQYGFGKVGKPMAAFRNIYVGLDANQYLGIAREGYTHLSDTGKVLELVFLPGYPVLAGILMMAIPNDALAGFIAAWAPFVAAGPVLYELLRLDYDHRKTMRILLLCCLMPAAAFYAFPMSESLFLLCAAGCLLNARKGRWLAAGLCGMAACFTRSLGILLLAPMAVEGFSQVMADPERQLHRREWARRAALALLTLLGLVLYLYINFIITGNPLAFMEYQRTHWSQQLKWFFTTAAMQTDYLVRRLTEDPRQAWGMWVPNLVVGFGSMALMLARGRKLRASYGAWFLVYFPVCYGASWLLSGPRYMLVFFPMAIAIEELPLKKWVAPLACGLLAAAYTFCFALRISVW